MSSQVCSAWNVQILLAAGRPRVTDRLSPSLEQLLTGSHTCRSSAPVLQPPSGCLLATSATGRILPGVKVCVLSSTLHMVTLPKPHLPHSFQLRSSHAWQHNNVVTVLSRMDVCGPGRQKPAILALHLPGSQGVQTQLQRLPLASCQSNGTCPAPRATFPEVAIQKHHRPAHENAHGATRPLHSTQALPSPAPCT